MKSTKIHSFLWVLFLGLVAVMAIVCIRLLIVNPTSSIAIGQTAVITPDPGPSLTAFQEMHNHSDPPSRKAGAGTIAEDGMAMFSSADTILNEWYVDLNGKTIRVFAGAISGDGANDLPKPWQGVLIVWVEGIPPDSTIYSKEGGYYETPDKVGPIQIVDANGMTLTLLTPDGMHAYYFDVSTRQFLSQRPSLPLSRSAGAGILLESSLPQVTTSGFSAIQNQWSEIKDGQKITVIAGRKTGDDQGGDFDVVQSSPDGKTVFSTTTYHTVFGPLSLFDVNGETLWFIGYNSLFVFDLNTRQFVYLPELPSGYFDTPQSLIPTRVPPGKPTPNLATPTLSPSAYPYPN